MQITAFANTPYASLSAWGGTSLAQGALGKSAARSSADAGQGLAVDASFAQDMLRRLTGQSPIAADSLTGDTAQAKDATGLTSALQDSMDYLRTNFGDQAATAAIGLVYQSVGDNPLTEDNLGRGLVNALKFVDRNFGAAAGNQAISYFNGSLNDQLNAYFDNGANERFLSVEAGMSGVLQQVQGGLADLGDSLGQGVADALGNILQDSLGDTVSATSMRQAATDIRTWLEQNYGVDAATSADTLFGSALGGQAPAQKGLLLDLAA